MIEAGQEEDPREEADERVHGVGPGGAEEAGSPVPQPPQRGAQQDPGQALAVSTTPSTENRLLFHAQKSLLSVHENHDIAIAMSPSRADPVLPWLGVFKCLYQSHCTDWGYLNI